MPPTRPCGQIQGLVISPTRVRRSDVINAEIVCAMVKYPRLMERPIVVIGSKAALGRPSENILKII
ncbi:MAG TPA: ArsC/Spx/MgsR family protein [Anaerolineae bacterium]